MFGVGKTISGGVLVNNIATQIPNCMLHLRSDLGVTLNGSGQVTRWEDQSGRGNHAVVAPGSNGPKFMAASLKSKNVLNFASTSTQALAIPNGSGDLTTSLLNGISVFVVWAWTDSSGATGTNIITSAPTGNWSNNWGLVNGPNEVAGEVEFWEWNFSVVGPPTSFVGLTGLTNNNYRCTVGTYDNNALVMHHYSDGVDHSAASIGIFTTSASQTIIGAVTIAGGSGAVSRYLNGNIAEIAVYNRGLSAIEAETLHQYSVKNYGTP